MSEYAFFEYRALLTSAFHSEQKGEAVHSLIRMEIDAQDGRVRRGAETRASSWRPGPISY